jgi:hypothetical protein
MDKLNFLSDKTKQILGLMASVMIIIAFVMPQMPDASEAVKQWSAWASQVIGLVSLMLGLQVFNPSKR